VQRTIAFSVGGVRYKRLTPRQSGETRTVPENLQTSGQDSRDPSVGSEHTGRGSLEPRPRKLAKCRLKKRSEKIATDHALVVVAVDRRGGPLAASARVRRRERPWSSGRTRGEALSRCMHAVRAEGRGQRRPRAGGRGRPGHARRAPPRRRRAAVPVRASAMQAVTSHGHARHGLAKHALRAAGRPGGWIDTLCGIAHASSRTLRACFDRVLIGSSIAG
jgi:hypothetical protein